MHIEDYETFEDFESLLTDNDSLPDFKLIRAVANKFRNELNKKDYYGDTFLMNLINSIDPKYLIDIIKILMDLGFDINTKNSQNMTLLNMLDPSEVAEIMKYQNRYFEKDGKTLYNAIIRNDINQVKKLITQGALLNYSYEHPTIKQLNYKNYWEPIHLVIKNNNITLFKLFLKHDIVISKRILNHIIESGNVEFMKTLLKHDKTILDDVNLGDALLIMGGKFNLDFVKLLLKYIDINSIDGNDNFETGLYVAVNEGNISLIKLLLQNGAKMTGFDHHNNLDFQDLVILFTNEEVFVLLLKAGFKPDKDIFVSISEILTSDINITQKKYLRKRLEFFVKNYQLNVDQTKVSPIAILLEDEERDFDKYDYEYLLFLLENTKKNLDAFKDKLVTTNIHLYALKNMEKNILVISKFLKSNIYSGKELEIINKWNEEKHKFVKDTFVKQPEEIAGIISGFLKAGKAKKQKVQNVGKINKLAKLAKQIKK